MKRTALTIIASALMAATAVQATPSNQLVVVPPTDLPELARQGGDAMLLHPTSDGRTLLYIEQERGSRLAAFDVTDPLHVKAEGSVQLDAAGPFDFVSPLGEQGELIRYRQGQEDAVLDLQKERTPKLNAVQGVKHVREQVTNAGTGTTFLLTENGLFLIRRPAVESDKRRREQEWFWQHTGD